VIVIFSIVICFSINYFFIDKPNMVQRFYWDALYIYFTEWEQQFEPISV